MNIEEERKAFESVCEDVHGLITNPWEVWQLAKSHAEEMAKPVVYVRQRPHGLKGFGVYIGETNHKRIWLSDVKADAIQWAKDNGYRVIE